MKKINFVFNKEYSDPDFDAWQGSQSKSDYSMIHNASNSALYDLLKSVNMVRYYKSDNLPNDVFFYEYNHHWWFPVESYFGDNGFLENSPCPEEILIRVRDKTAFIVVTIPTESPFQYNMLWIIHDYFLKIGLPQSQIIYFTCSPNAEELYRNMCHTKGIDKTFTFEYIPYYPINTFRFHPSTLNSYQVKTKDKDILMFNRRWGNQPHRVLFLYQLFKLGLIDRAYTSFLKFEVDNHGSYSSHYLNFKSLLPSLVHDQTILDKIENSLPLILDHDDLTSSLMYNHFDNTKSLYDNSFFHVTSETNFFTDIIHITEKTFKPMVYKQPFIMLSSPYFLSALRDMGFKTFGTIWDESYDLETNHEQRFFKIVDLVKNLCLKPPQEKLEIMQNCAEIVEYNYSLSTNRPHSFLVNLVEKYGSNQ